MWNRILVACVTFLVVACQSSHPIPTPLPGTPLAAPASQPPAARGGSWLYLELSSGPGPGRIAVANAASGEQLRAFPSGVPTRDWSILYTAECREGSTTISAIDLVSGKTMRARTIDGCYSLPPAGLVGVAGLSPNGKWLALADVGLPRPPGTPTPGYQGQSRFVVLNTSLVESPVFVDLKGRFAVDAVDDAGTSLYLIEDLPPTAPTSIGTPYQVRRYDLATKSLELGAIVDKTATEPIMDGLRQTSVASADGQWLYSLYLNNVTGPFIHALNLDNRFALCLDLPTANKGDVEKQMLWTLAMSPDGRKLYAANGALGLVAQLDPTNAVIQRTSELKLAEAATPAPQARIVPSFATTAEAKRLLLGGAAVTSDGKTLLVIGDLGLLAAGTDDLQLKGRLLPNLPLRSLVASPNGSSIFVVPDESAGRLIEIDPASGAVVSTKSVANLWSILGIGRG
jgi:hypothetical protein